MVRVTLEEVIMAGAGWADKKIPYFLIFLWRQINKKIDSLRSGDRKVVSNLTTPKGNLCRGCTKHSCSQRFPEIYRKRSVLESLLKHRATLLERRETLAQVFSFEFWYFFKKHLFSQNAFSSLKNYSGNIQNLPLECWYNSWKTAVKNFF